MCLKMKQMLPAALEIAMEEDTEFRRGLPLDYLTYMGVQNSDKVNTVIIYFLLTSLVAFLFLNSNCVCNIG